MTAIAGIVGLLLLMAVASDAFEVMLLPRRVRRKLRFVRFFFRRSWALWSLVGNQSSKGRWRDSFLSLFGPLSMIGLLICWVVGLIVGFGLVEWALEASGSKPPNLFRAMYLSGSTFFTLELCVSSSANWE